jgi:hypothetical protein
MRHLECVAVRRRGRPMVLDIYSIISRRQAARIAMPPNAKLRILPGGRRQDGVSQWKAASRLGNLLERKNFLQVRANCPYRRTGDFVRGRAMDVTLAVGARKLIMQRGLGRSQRAAFQLSFPRLGLPSRRRARGRFRGDFAGPLWHRERGLAGTGVRSSASRLHGRRILKRAPGRVK